MTLDEDVSSPLEARFEELATDVAGFYRSWLVYLGLELGLFARIRDAGEAGIEPAALAAAAGCVREPIEAWVRAADAGELVVLEGGRVRIDSDVAAILLDDDRPEYLGGQFVWTVVASLDYDDLAEFFRTGRTIPERPPRFHRAIEALTVQDIAVFFQEALAVLPDLAADLARGIRVLDVACGGGRWLVAIGRRFPNTTAVGVEFEPDSVARAMKNVGAAGLADRIRIEARDVVELPYRGEFDLVYYQDALHEIADPGRSLATAWQALRPGGRLVVLDWCLPSTAEESRTLQGELLWAVQLDELYQGTRLYTREEFAELFRSAGLPEPTAIDLPSGATVFVASRPVQA